MRWTERGGALGALLVLLTLWEGGVRLAHLPPYVLPPPTQVLLSFFQDWSLLLHHAGATLAAVGLGLGVGIAGGVGLAVLVFYVRPLSQALAPFLVGSQVIPVFAVAPLFVLWFGYGLLPRAAVAGMITFFPVAVNLLDGLRSVRPEFLEFFQALGVPERKLLRMVRLPAAVPFLLSGLRVGATLSLVGATVGEWVGSSRGLGYLMVRANALLRLDRVFAVLLLLTLLGLAMYEGISILERLLPPRVRSPR